MKNKITLLAALFLFSFNSYVSAQAENFKLFNFDLGMLYAKTPSTNMHGGGIYLEPKFNVLDNVAVGLKWEGVLSIGGNFDYAETGSVKISTSIINSFMFTGDYFFTTTNKRPFVGGGMGRYVFVGQNINDNHNSGEAIVKQEAGTSFGFMLRGGIQLSGFRLSLEYNMPLKQGTYFYQNVNSSGSVVIGTSSTRQFSKNYFGFKIGGVIGSLRK